MPQLWQPTNGALMSNDVNEAKPTEDSVACIALSKNDSYVMSASGGKVSLFNMMTFKVGKNHYKKFIELSSLVDRCMPGFLRHLFILVFE